MTSYMAYSIVDLPRQQILIEGLSYSFITVLYELYGESENSMLNLIHICEMLAIDVHVSIFVSHFLSQTP